MPGATPWKRTICAFGAATTAFFEVGSFEQSGNAFALVVTQMRTLPFALRSPLIATSSVVPLSAAAVPLMCEAAKAKVSAANLVPEPEI